MKTVTILTQKDENFCDSIGMFGATSQSTFQDITDALYYIYITSPLNSVITLKKTSDGDGLITIKEEFGGTSYYGMKTVEPLHYERSES